MPVGVTLLICTYNLRECLKACNATTISTDAIVNDQPLASAIGSLGSDRPYDVSSCQFDHQVGVQEVASPRNHAFSPRMLLK